MNICVCMCVCVSGWIHVWSTCQCLLWSLCFIINSASACPAADPNLVNSFKNPFSDGLIALFVCAPHTYILNSYLVCIVHPHGLQHARRDVSLLSVGICQRAAAVVLHSPRYAVSHSAARGGVCAWLCCVWASACVARHIQSTDRHRRLPCSLRWLVIGWLVCRL